MTRRHFDVAVLGAGVIGVSTAWFLAKAGKSVVVLDRLPGPALETSFANGGQISVCHAEPWATPGAPLKILKWLARDDAPLLFRPRFDPSQWWWLLSWLAECLPARTTRNTLAILDLALHSRQVLQQLRQELQLDYDYRGTGILHFFRDAQSFDHACAQLDLMAQHGCPLTVLDPAAISALEPALSTVKLVGGTFSPADESGDAHKFTLALAAHAEVLGVQFHYGQEIVGLVHDSASRRIDGVRLRDLGSAHYHEVTAAQYVLALGPYSAALARSIGIGLTIYPTKGYSVTVPVGDAARLPGRSLTDDRYKTVFTPLGDRLRIAGTAELDGYSHDLNQIRCAAMIDLTKQIFPDLGAYDRAEFWTGLRPATPSNMPYLGASPYKNLFLNTGHGTLGWTMAAGSAERLAGIMARR